MIPKVGDYLIANPEWIKVKENENSSVLRTLWFEELKKNNKYKGILVYKSNLFQTGIKY